MNRKLLTLSVLATMLGAACAAEVGPETATLGETVAPAELPGAIYYLDRSVSLSPMTESQMLELGAHDAVPVELRVHAERFLVAWDAPWGEGRIGHRPSVVGAWLVGERQAIAGGVVDGTDEPGRVAGPGPALPALDDAPLDTPLTDLTQVVEAQRQVHVEWIDDVAIEFLEYWLFHPECA